MNRVSLWAAVLALPALSSSQTKTGSKTPVFDPAKSGVKVIYAPEKPGAAPALAAGQRAHVDPQGKLKDADPEETRELDNRLQGQFTQLPASIVPFSGPAGSVGVKLGEEFMVAATASIDAAGKLQVQCAPVQKNAPAVSKSAAKEASDVK